MKRVATLLFLPFLLSAQGELGPRGRRLPPGPDQTGRPILTMIQQRRMERIQQTLGLPENQARAIAERWGKSDQEFIERTRQIQQIRHQFNQILIGPGNDDEKNAKLKPLLDRFIELRRQQQDSRHRFEEEVRASLTTAQQVRLIVLVEDMQKELLETLRETVRENRRGRMGGF